MVAHRLQADLDNALSLLLSCGPKGAFGEYWELYKDTACIPDPKGMYYTISQDATYRNLVIADKPVSLT